MLDLWLMVVICTYVMDIGLDSLPPLDRFSVGWYAGRICGVVSSSVVLSVLLYEITKLYAQLLDTARTRDKLLAMLDTKNQSLEAANAELAQRSKDLARSNAELEQ